MVVVAAKTTSTTCSLPKTTRARPAAAARLAPIDRAIEAAAGRLEPHAFLYICPLQIRSSFPRASVGARVLRAARCWRASCCLLFGRGAGGIGCADRSNTQPSANALVCGVWSARQSRSSNSSPFRIRKSAPRVVSRTAARSVRAACRPPLLTSLPQKLAPTPALILAPAVSTRGGGIVGL